MYLSVVVGRFAWIHSFLSCEERHQWKYQGENLWVAHVKLQMRPLPLSDGWWVRTCCWLAFFQYCSEHDSLFTPSQHSHNYPSVPMSPFLICDCNCQRSHRFQAYYFRMWRACGGPGLSICVVLCWVLCKYCMYSTVSLGFVWSFLTSLRFRIFPVDWVTKSCVCAKNVTVTKL